MQQLPAPLAPLAAFPQFVLYKAVPIANRPGKTDKFPCNAAGDVVDAQTPAHWLTAEAAIAALANHGSNYGIGFVFTATDPFFFVDLDGCLLEDGSGWSPFALEVLGLFAGAAVEVSQSGRGLHIFGTGAAPAHACKNTQLGLEFYTEGRFVALTGDRAIGSASVDCSATLSAFVTRYVPPKATTRTEEWTDGPCEGWNGLTDDGELIRKACETKSGAGVFGGGSTFAALWEGDETRLAESYHDDNRAFDASSADMALAQHLAFWTGNDCERILRLMQHSGLVREKWNREDYLIRTITRAVSMQETVYTAGGTAEEVVKLKGSAKQQQYANSIVATKLVGATDEQRDQVLAARGPLKSAQFWIENRDRPLGALLAAVTPTAAATAPMATGGTAQLITGYQFLSATQQVEYFAGCVYIQDQHRIFIPGGQLLKSEQFNATYGGYSFQMDDTGEKTTRKAWEAFTESQVVRFPKAESVCFRPDLEPRAVFQEEGRLLVNTYVPIETPRQIGDATPFLQHLERVLPVPGDRDILLAYMAACVQHKGVKFQWAPLLQGAEGNGKTLFTRCVASAVGSRYTHMPPASEISEKFNEWLFYKLFIGIEDVYVPDHKKEVIEILKPMITNDKLAMRAMQQSQVMGDNRANFMLNSNHKDAIKKTRTDRRFAVFFTAQQTDQDLARDGMAGDYFPRLYEWLRTGGYAIVAEFLTTYAIPDELNPATRCHRAPETSSTHEALAASLGGIEQEVLEAIDEGRPGFAGGWISSMAFDRLLQARRAERAIPPNKRRELLQELGYDWHPALTDGRVNNPVPFDGGKPRLFIRDGHIHRNLATAAEVAKAYESAQTVTGSDTAQAQRVFS